MMAGTAHGQEFNFGCPIDYDSFINENPFLKMEITEVYETYSINDTITINGIKWTFDHLYEQDLQGVGEPNPGGGWCGAFYENKTEEGNWRYSDYFNKWWTGHDCSSLDSTKGFPGLSLQTVDKGSNKIWMTIEYGQHNKIGKMQLTRLGDNFGHIGHWISLQPSEIYFEVEYQCYEGDSCGLGYNWFEVVTLDVELIYDTIKVATEEYNKL